MGSDRVRGAVNRAGVALWRLLTWWRTFQVLLLCLAVLLLVGVAWGLLVPGSIGTRGGMSAWQPQAGGLPTSPDGGVDPLDSLPVRFFLAVLGIVCLARLIEVWIPAWSLPPLSPLARERAVCDDEPQAVARALSSLLTSRGLATRCSASEGMPCRCVAWRRGPARWLKGLLYLGGVLFLVAAVACEHLGYVGEPVDLLLGVSTGVGPDSDLCVMLRQIEVFPSDDGVPLIHRSEIVAYRDGAEAERAWLYPGKPAAVQGLTFYQVRSGPAMRVAARGADGKALLLRDPGGEGEGSPVLRVGFSGTEQERLVLVPAAGLIVSLVYYPSLPSEGVTRPVVHVRVQRATGGQALAERFLTENDVLLVGGVRLDLGFEYSVTVRPEREPELPIIALGALALAFGVLAQVMWPDGHLWLAISDQEQGTVIEIVTPVGTGVDVTSRDLMVELCGGED